MVITQTPPTQVVVLTLGRAPQLFPQLPQLPTVVCVFISQPLATTPSQSAKPASQVLITQAPDVQTVALTLGRLVQSTIPAQVAPQEAESLRLTSQPVPT